MNELYIENWDLMFFKMANLIARKSKDPSSMVGSVAVKDNIPLMSGFNGFCMGVKDLPERYENRELKYKFISHSESNVCLLAGRQGISLSGSSLYTQTFPCENCAKSIIQSGIKTVKTLRSCENIWADYNKNWIESKKVAGYMFQEAGVSILEYDIKCGDEILVGGIYKI
jgi:dCMP deaminase